MYTSNFTVNVTREMVIGRLKSAGSRDPDVLRGIVDGMLGEQKPVRIIALAGIIVGALLCLTIIGIIPAIVILPVTIWLFLRTRRNIRVIHEGYEEFMQSRGAAAAAAA